MDTSMGLTSVASLSLNLSMSMSGGMGTFTNMARSNPILSRRGSKDKLEGSSAGHTPAACRSPALGGPEPALFNHIRPGGSTAVEYSPAIRVSDRFNKSMASVEEEKSSDVSEDSTSPDTFRQNNFQTEAHIEHNMFPVPKTSANFTQMNDCVSNDKTNELMEATGKPNVTFLLENEVISLPTDEDYVSREQQRLLLDLPSISIPCPPASNYPVVTTVQCSSPNTPTSPSTITSMVSPTVSNGPMLTSDSLIDLDSRATSNALSSDSDGLTTPTDGIFMEVRNGSNTTEGRPDSYVTATF